MEFTGIDHLVITAEDVEETCSFYEALGAEIVTFGDDRRAVQFGKQKINVHAVDSDIHLVPGVDPEIDLVAENPTVGGGDFCLLTETPIEQVETHLREQDLDIIAGPVEHPGAAGQLTSVYTRDPNGNLVEIATYENTP